MTRTRSHLVRAALAAACAAPLLAAAPAGAQTPTTTTPTTTPPASPTIPQLCFPVEGPSYYGSPPSTSLATTYWTDSFGAPRSGHTHEGQDIMSVRGVKMRHLLAAASGTIVETYFSNASGNRIVIRDDAGWYFVYIHVNNDRPGTDDASAARDQVFAPGIEVGARVTAGQFIGYLGDSGNAESAGAHNHFEVRQPLAGRGSWSSATAVNATTALKDAMAHPERCGSTRYAPFVSAGEEAARANRRR